MSRYLAIARRVFVESDTITVRVIMGVSSLLFAAGLFAPLETFKRPTFAGMQALMGEVPWALCFLAHGLGVAWRIVDARERVGWGFGINAFGLIIWIVSVGLIGEAVGEYSPANAMEITVILAAFVALIRTGLNEEKFTA